jgi:DNA invertase Pin-like site-specific DNA recombinase
MFLRAYLRASTAEQDASRALEDLQAFAIERGMKIAARYVENESGASLKRPELFRLLNDSQPGDVLLIEQVDRLSRLNAEDWQTLKATIAAKRVRVVALDLPTSWQLIGSGDEMTQRMLEALNGMMLDMLAAIARKDYEDRRRRTAQGIEKAKLKTGEDKVYRGRPVNVAKHLVILDMLDHEMSWSSIQAATGVSRSTILRVVNDRRAAQSEAALIA